MGLTCSFRFVALLDRYKEVFRLDPDAPLEWNDMELVIVPAQHDVICPICLDTPVVPRLTKCGHFFCWPCILRYAAATSSVVGSGNWRKCPICFESISTRQLKSVFFSQVEDYTSAGQRLADVGIPMVLLRGDPNTCIVQPVEEAEEQEQSEKGAGQLSQSPLLAPRRLYDLSPFDKISFVDRQFVKENVIGAEARELEDRLRMMSMDMGSGHSSSDVGDKPKNGCNGHFDLSGGGEDEPDRVYLELALTMVEDRLQALESNMDLDLTTTISGNSTTSPASTCSSTSTHLPSLPSALPSPQTTKIYFHQAADGQPFFLHPLSIKMLKRHFDVYADLPRTLPSCPILEIEMAIMTEDIRKRHRYLHHLPLGCQFGLCEVDLTGIVSSTVLEEYAEDLANRAANRRRKAHKEERLAAEANRRAQQRQTQWLETTVASLEGSRCGSPAAPGVAMGIFNSEEYYENFPLPGSEDVSRGEGPAATTSATVISGTGGQSTSAPRPIPPSAPNSINSTPSLPMAGSFASIAATSPQSDGFLVIPSAMGGRTGVNYNGSVISSTAFELSFDDLPVATVATSTAAAALISSPSASSPAIKVHHHHPHHYHNNASPSPPLTSPPTTVTNSGGANKKGKRVLLVSNAQRRSS